MIEGKAFLERRYHAKRFILYFQAYSNTFAPVSELQEIYDFALDQMDFTEMVIATRPDCISPEKADLISSYADRVPGDLWVELGLQSADDKTLRQIGRGHTVQQFVSAFELLRSRRLKVSAHVILGLPREGYDEVKRTAALISELHPDAVKIHNLHIPSGTKMYQEYLHGELTAPSAVRHMSLTMCFLERIPEDIIIQRLVCDTPRHRLAAPADFPAKGSYVNELQRRMEAAGVRQGRLC